MGTARKCIHGTVLFGTKACKSFPLKASQFQHCMLSFGLLVCHMTTNSVIFIIAPNIQCNPLASHLFIYWVLQRHCSRSQPIALTAGLFTLCQQSSSYFHSPCTIFCFRWLPFSAEEICSTSFSAQFSMLLPINSRSKHSGPHLYISQIDINLHASSGFSITGDLHLPWACVYKFQCSSSTV